MRDPMLILGIVFGVLIVFDIVALRFGVDSRPSDPRDTRSNWW